MNILSNFSKTLKELMSEDGIKSDKLAKIIGVSGQNVRAWCGGKQAISLSNAIKLADYFECSVDYLCGFCDVYTYVSPRGLPPFYENMRNVMKSVRISRYRITTESTIKDSYFTYWKNGADPNLASVAELAKYLGVTVDYLIGRV